MKTTTDHPQKTRLISKREAARRVNYHPVSMMRLVRDGRFPQPVKLAQNKLAFVEHEVDEHISALLEARKRGCK